MKSNSNKTSAKSPVSSASKSASKKSRGAKRSVANVANVAKRASSSFSIQEVLDGAAPYAIPGAGVLATTALAATGYFLRDTISSFARGTTERGVGEMLRLLRLERRSSIHWMSTLGAFAGGLAVGAIAGAFAMPRIGAALQSSSKDKTPESINATSNKDPKDGVVSRIPNGSSTQHSS